MAAGSVRPLRVLHIISKLQHGGIETWLMHIFRNSDPALVRHDVLLSKPEAGVHDEEAERLGVTIHRPRERLNRFQYAKQLDRLLKERTFDVVHSHVYLFTGAMLAVARRRAVPMRIAHAHQASITQGDVTPWQRVKHVLFKAAIKANATHLIGISEDAITEIAGPGWRSHPKARILIYGFDFSAFADARARASALRRKFGIQSNETLVGHVGRFVRQKNHQLLVDAFAVAAARLTNARLILFGEGELEGTLRAQVARLGLEDKIIFAGTTTDIAAAMRAFDLFVLPSRHEGLGIVVVEAQAAGTPSLLSDIVPEEAIVIPELTAHAPATAGAPVWADAIVSAADIPSPARDECWHRLQRSSYGIERCVSDLMSIYQNGR